MKPLIIVGAGGFAREASLWALDAGYTVMGFWDPESDDPKRTIHGIKVRDDIRVFNREFAFLVAVGDPSARTILSLEARSRGFQASEPIIHPTAVVARTAYINRGSIICPNVVVADNVTIHGHSILNLGVTVGHDTVIGSYTTVSPGANISGTVNIGAGSYIGTGACIREKIKIGPDAVVGMGAVVVKSVAEGITVIGNPAKPKERK